MNREELEKENAELKRLLNPLTSQTLPEDEDGYPVFLNGERRDFEGEIVFFTASEVDHLTEVFWSNGDRDSFRKWLEKVDGEYQKKDYASQNNYKGEIINRLAQNKRRFNND